MNPTKGVPPLLTKSLDPDRPKDRCFWFLNCTNPATKQVEHPTLGWVACCDNHIAWLQTDENSPPKVGT